MITREFEFSAGCLSLNLVETVADRKGDSKDLLSTTDDLGRWLTGAGLSVDAMVAASARQLKLVRELREAIYRTASALVSKKIPNTIDLDLINAWAAKPDLRPQLTQGSVRYVSRNPANAVLSIIAANAVLCFCEIAQHNLRRCPDCGMLFRDNSRPQTRSWCSSASGCGNRAKVRRHRATKKFRKVYNE